MKTNKKDKFAKIDNVREWMVAKFPSEPDIPGIDPGLTFSWLILHMGEPVTWFPLVQVSTVPRERIFEEAITRQLRGLRRAGISDDYLHELVDEIYGEG